MAKRDFSDVMKEAIGQRVPSPEIGAIEAARGGVLAVAPGLKNILSDIGSELSRLGTQGAMELSQALFNGAAFTPYGPGQWKSPGREGGPEEPAIEQERERGGREM